MTPKVVVASAGRERTEAASYAASASRAAFVAGLIYLVGSLVDLGVLWLGQRQPGLQWEFVAINSTVEAWPRMVLAVGLMYVGLHIGGSTSVILYRGLAATLLVLGVSALAMGGLMVLNYLQVAPNLEGDGGALVRSAAVKTEILCGLYVVTLVPIGIMGLFGLGRRT